MKTQAQIFLAHASEDKDAVRRLYARLARRGFKPWLDEIDLIPGQNWRVEIPKAIKQSDAFVACLSRRSVEKTGYVQKEFRLALDAYAEKPPESIYIIPVKLDDCEVPDIQLPQLGIGFRDLQWLDLWKRDGFDRLLCAIKHSVGKRHPTDAPETSPSANSAGLEICGPFYVGLAWHWDTAANLHVRIMEVNLRNQTSNETFDDVIVELRLPSGIEFVKSKATPSDKPMLGHVTLPLSHPVNPGAFLELGYVKKHSGWPIFGADSARNETLAWKITARDISPTSGSLDISWLHEKPKLADDHA
jgi:hypothetical protein